MHYNKKLDLYLYVLLTPFILGLFSVFTFRPYNLTFLSFLILTLIFLNLTYVSEKTKKKYRKKTINYSLLVGYSFGFGFFLSNTFWISNSLNYEESLKYFIPISIVLIPAFLAIFFALGFYFVSRFLKYKVYSVILFSSTLAFIDFIRGKILTGFPWNLWSYTWSWAPEAIQSLQFLGLYSFNFICILLFTLPSVLFFKYFKKKFYFSIFYSLVFLILYLFGNYNINTQNNEKISNSAEKINFKVISPGFDINYSLKDEDVKRLIDKLILFSNPISSEKTVFIWPEGVFGYYDLKDLKKFDNIFKKNFNKNHKIIFGVNTYDKDKNKHYNSLVLVDHNFRLIYKYNKRKLVPFGEYLPLKDIVSKTGFREIAISREGFIKGTNNPSLKIGNFSILTLICYEIIFPKYIQSDNKDSDIIINISQDAWFGDSFGPHQHFSKAIFRAVESNAFLVRSANKGVSSIISNTGNVIKFLSPNEKGSLDAVIFKRKIDKKNKNDLIFFLLLFTTVIISYFKPYEK